MNLEAFRVALNRLYDCILLTNNPFSGEIQPGPGWENGMEEWDEDEKKPSEEGKGS